MFWSDITWETQVRTTSVWWSKCLGRNPKIILLPRRLCPHVLEPESTRATTTTAKTRARHKVTSQTGSLRTDKTTGIHDNMTCYYYVLLLFLQSNSQHKMTIHNQKEMQKTAKNSKEMQRTAQNCSQEMRRKKTAFLRTSILHLATSLFE